MSRGLFWFVMLVLMLVLGSEGRARGLMCGSEGLWIKWPGVEVGEMTPWE